MSKVSDNVNSDFPARMSDGRFITDYSPICQYNLAIQKDMTSWQYKTYLTRYADQIRNVLNNHCFQRLLQFRHVINCVIGSSADLVCTS